jgi:dTDP-4-amino-4,6-dideoxygalactose transaminase
MAIKLVDVAAQNREARAEIERELDEIHAQAAYVGGAPVEAFEREFAAFLGVRKVVGVGSGTDALRLALAAAGVGPGDEVITVPMTFIATVEAILQCGARPVFVDIDPVTCNMSASALREYLESGGGRSRALKAVVPVHFYGMPAAMAEIGKLASDYGLAVIEDACQAHGAQFFDGDRWVKAGTMGTAGCFSFYPGKNLGAWGEGGAVATDDEALAERIAMLRDHGRASHYLHEHCGYNARLDAIQAVVLRAKLARLGAWNARRREIADSYREQLEGCDGVQPPFEPSDVEHCYHLYVIRSGRRDAIRRALLSNGIECGIHYPVPLHLQPACRFLGYRRGDFPASERVADAVLSLPMHPHLTDLDVARITDTIRHALAKSELLTAPHSGNAAASA